MTKTSRATEKVVFYSVREQALETVLELKQKGPQIIALEITTESKPIHAYKFNSNQPIVLVIGD